MPAQCGPSGSLNAPLGSLVTTLIMLPGAVNEAVQLTAQVVSAPPAGGGLQLLGQSFAIEAHTGSGAPVNHFNQLYTLVIHYQDADLQGSDENSLQLFYWNGVEWVVIPATVNAAANTITAALDHLTVFTLGQGTGARLFMPVVRR